MEHNDDTTTATAPSIKNQKIGGKQQHGLGHATGSNTAHEDDNPFLVQPTSQARRQRPKSPPSSRQSTQDSRDDDNNPFLISRTPVSSRRNATSRQQDDYHDSDTIQQYSMETELRQRHSSANEIEPSTQVSSGSLRVTERDQQAANVRHHPHHSTESSERGRSGDKFHHRNVGMADLKKSRIELKAWEADFKATHQRDPTQDDIMSNPVMTKKYRAYAKIKKALALKAAQASEHAAPSANTAEGSEDSKQQRQLVSPTRPTRTLQEPDPPRTPTRKQSREVVEFVSPRKVTNSAGFMSPSRSNKHEEDRHQFLSSISSPKSKRTQPLLLSPSKNGRTQSLLSSPSFTSPGLSTIKEQVKSTDTWTVDGDSTAVHSHLRDNPFLQQRASSSHSPRTPTRNKTSTLHFPNPFQSPTRSRASPLFGGMNNRLSKRLPRQTTPVIKDLEPTLEYSSVQDDDMPDLNGAYNDVRDKILKSPLPSTPQKSAVAKAARSLLRRPSVDLSVLSSPHRSRMSFHDDIDGFNATQDSSDPQLLRRRGSVSGIGSPFVASDVRRDSLLQQQNVHDALDSMSIQDASDVSHLYSPSNRHVQHGFDSLESPSSRIFHSPGRRSPSQIQSLHAYTLPRTPSQQPSLTFSQPTPGSATSDVDFMAVPPGFHSHNRRRQVRSTLFLPSQEADDQFEREFNLKPKQTIQMIDIYDAKEVTTATQDLEHGQRTAVDTNSGANVDEVKGVEDNDSWVEHQSGAEEESPFGLAARTVPKKKYTQKRTTRLHRIVVAPSEKARPIRAARSSSRIKKPIKVTEKEKAVLNGDHDVAPADSEADVAVEPKDGLTLENPAPSTTEGMDSLVTTNSPMTAASTTITTAAPASASTFSAKNSVPHGWGNSNKPMVKSDRRTPGVGQGRAGAKRPAASKYGGSGADGNFVAYNLQRGGFRKGGARGKSRFGGSKFGGYGGAAAGGPGSGRTMFDSDSWRAEFDKDFDDATLVMSLADGDMGIEDEEEGDGMPWYGNVNDTTDPYVITLSRKYLQGQFGEANDPEEYIKALELQNTLTEDGNTTPEFRVNVEYILKKMWGYTSFRDGQLDSIKRILGYESSLLILPTGSGKSLSYQLPAYILSKLGFPSLTLVISPMISLMYDQVKCLPPGLNGACWTSVEQSTAQFRDFMEKLTSNTIKILFISPEKLQSQSFLSLVRTRRIPRISFLCVDEVHCLSEWSHNFRSAYLLLNHVVKTDLKSPCVLGLTGTATEGTKDSICAMLDIDRTTGVLSGQVIRENLAMTVSLEREREPALLNLLQSPRFASMDAILIYVMKQSQADQLSAFLRVRNFSAESYHAGKSSQDRQRIQQRFMNDHIPKPNGGGRTLGHSSGASVGVSSSSGGIRILVATIAFGLGLNKSNIRSVIHYCIPKSLENYIQEIGRSGRDGEKAYCHMFLNQNDYLLLRSLAYADGMDWGSVLRLIKKLFSRRDIDNDSGLPSPVKAVKGSNRKRRGSVDANNNLEYGCDSADGKQDEVAIKGTAKKRKQNDYRSMSVKTSKADRMESKQQSLVMSTASILVIPLPQPSSNLVGNVMVTENNVQPRKRIVVVREDAIEEEFDVKKEVLATLLSYIELDETKSIKVLGSISAKCTVKFLQGSEALSELAENVPLVDMILKQGVLTGHNSNSGGSQYGGGGRGRRGTNKTGLAGTTLSMAYCCDTMSLCQQSEMSYTELVQELQVWKRKKWVVFEMTDPALCVEILKEPADSMMEQRRLRQQRRSDSEPLQSTLMDVDGDTSRIGQDDTRDAEAYEDDHDNFVVALADRLYRKVCAVERVGVAKVDQVYELFQSVATATWQQQEVFQPRAQGVNNDNGQNEDENELSTEYEEDVDPEYIQMRARIKAKRQSLSLSLSSTNNNDVTESEMVLRQGIQDYFARQSGVAIGGLHAEDVLFNDCDQNQGQGQDREQGQDGSTVPVPARESSMDKTMQLYRYENVIVANLQRKWRSAVEVDLKVFLSQQWQQQQQSTEHSSRPIDSPRVVSRIFHGIHSPCYPVWEWSKHKYWAKYIHYDFAQLMQMADRIIKDQRRLRLNQQQR